MRKGFSIIETLVYISLLAAIFLLFVNFTTGLVRSYGIVKAIRDLDNGALVSMERITREIRGSTTVDMGQTILDTSPGKLVLNQIDSLGATTQTVFLVVNGNLNITISGVDKGSLLPDGVTVTNLKFTKIDSTHSNAIKIDITLRSTRGKITKDENYHSTIIMRGSYK